MSSLSAETINILSKFSPPVLTTAQKSSITPVAGTLIYNSDDKVLEVYDGSAWILVLGTRSGSGSGSTPLYSFTSATFTSGGQTGYLGPSLAQAISGLTNGSAFSSNTQYFNVTSGIMSWTVPQTGSYKITAAGAKGGQSTNWGPQGGNGALMVGTFTLTKSDIIKLVVGQPGGSNTYDGGGGGGSFVVKSDNSPLIIAAGGGGGSASGFSGSGQQAGGTATNGSSTSWATGGSNGSGGGGYSASGGGGGLTGNGSGSWFGQSFVNGANGGPGQAQGGFGGGGGGGGTNGAGGGGGYSGGAAAPWSYYGAGGGSYNGGTSQSGTIGGNSQANGYITIEKQ
jgi:tripartite motif-containing protein 56